MSVLVLLDDNSDWLNWLARQVDSCLDLLVGTAERPALRLFNDDSTATGFIAEHSGDVVGLIQDLSRSRKGWGSWADRVKASDGYHFLFDVFKGHLQGRRALIVTGSLPDEAIALLTDRRNRVDFLHKRDVAKDVLLAKIHWLLEAGRPLEDDAVGAESLINSLSPAWDDVCRFLARRPESLYVIDPRKFEELVAEMFREHGWQVELTARSRDHGYDIIALRRELAPLKVLIEAKRYAKDRAVPVSIVRSLFGVRSSNNVSKVILATSSHISDYAKREFTSAVPWQLSFVEGHQILEWCRRKSGVYVLDQDDPS